VNRHLSPLFALGEGPQQLVQPDARLDRADPQAAQDLRGRRLAVAQQAEQDVLGTD